MTEWRSKFPTDLSVAEFITYAAAAIAVVLLLIAFFSEKVFEFVKHRPLFEILVLALLLEILWILLRRPADAGLAVDDDAFRREMSRLIKSGQVDSVQVMAAGMSSLNTAIQELCDARVGVQVVCQHPETAVDKRDGKRSLESIDLIYHLKEKRFLDCLEGKFVREPATIRGVLLKSRRARLEYLFVGWYTYSGNPPKIRGRSNPMLFVTSGSQSGRTLIAFFSEVFTTRWNRQDSQPWPKPPKDRFDDSKEASLD